MATLTSAVSAHFQMPIVATPSELETPHAFAVQRGYGGGQEPHHPALLIRAAQPEPRIPGFRGQPASQNLQNHPRGRVL